MRFIILILLLSVAGCSEHKGPPVRFIVPDGYRGVITITRDPQSGISVPMSNSEFVITIPASGKMSVSSFDFVMGEHIVAACYASGEPLPPGHDPEAVAFRLVTGTPETGTPDLKTVVYVVGTHKEEEDELKKH